IFVGTTFSPSRRRTCTGFATLHRRSWIGRCITERSRLPARSEPWGRPSPLVVCHGGADHRFLWSVGEGLRPAKGSRKRSGAPRGQSAGGRFFDPARFLVWQGRPVEQA